MNIVIFGENNQFVNELRDLVETRINCLSVQAFFDDNDDYLERLKLVDIDVFLMEINTRNFKDCFQTVDVLRTKKSSIRLIFLYDYVLTGWISKINDRQIRLVSKKSEDLVSELKKAISGKEAVEYPSEISLTAREEEVLQLSSFGNKNPVIAEKLDVSVRTVEMHMANIREKFGENTKEGAIRRGKELGILPPDFEFSEEFW